MPNLEQDKKTGRILFTKEMKKDYTILFPMMAPIHFTILKNVFSYFGYKTELLTTTGPEIAHTGLKYVHNDTCYPAILVIGQLIDALNSGKYDLEKTALMITQTGGGCRASNYINLLRKALKKAGYGKILVVSLNINGMEKNSGFRITLPLLRRAACGLVYGDALMLLRNQVAPYELVVGESNLLVEKWVDEISNQLGHGKGCSLSQLELNLNRISDDFSKIAAIRTKKIKVGIVGEIFVKYASLGNNNLEDFLAVQDCEVCLPRILSFIMYSLNSGSEDIRLYGGNPFLSKLANLLMHYLVKIENILISAVKRNPDFTPPARFSRTKSLVNGVISIGVKMGEGWLLTAEMLELAEMGYENIICTQPFGCLPNHICGKGMMKRVKMINERANIVAIDYDPGATKVNQENRIKLMLAVARENLFDSEISKEINPIAANTERETELVL